MEEHTQRVREGKILITFWLFLPQLARHHLAPLVVVCHFCSFIRFFLSCSLATLLWVRVGISLWFLCLCLYTLDSSNQKKTKGEEMKALIRMCFRANKVGKLSRCFHCYFFLSSPEPECVDEFSFHFHYYKPVSPCSGERWMSEKCLAKNFSIPFIFFCSLCELDGAASGCESGDEHKTTK